MNKNNKFDDYADRTAKKNDPVRAGVEKVKEKGWERQQNKKEKVTETTDGWNSSLQRQNWRWRMTWDKFIFLIHLRLTIPLVYLFLFIYSFSQEPDITFSKNSFKDHGMYVCTDIWLQIFPVLQSSLSNAYNHIRWGYMNSFCQVIFSRLTFAFHWTFKKKQPTIIILENKMKSITFRILDLLLRTRLFL